MPPTRWPRSPRPAALGVPLADAASALARFEGLKRRLETVGEAAGVTVIDDFAHNPDKIDATLATLRAQPGRLLIMFQPHGYGPLAKMGEELADSFAGGMAPDDRLYLPDPVYQGGTVERIRGSDWLAEAGPRTRRQADHIAERAAIGEALLAEAARRRPHPDHGRARRHAERVRGGAGRAAQRSGTERAASASSRHGQARNRHRLDASRKSDANGCSSASRRDMRMSSPTMSRSSRRRAATRCRASPRRGSSAAPTTSDGSKPGRRDRRHHRPARRLDLSHHLVARPRPRGAREQRRAARARLEGRSTRRSRSSWSRRASDGQASRTVPRLRRRARRLRSRARSAARHEPDASSKRDMAAASSGSASHATAISTATFPKCPTRGCCSTRSST